MKQIERARNPGAIALADVTSNQRQQFAWWKTQLGELRLSDVTAADIVECRDRLLNTPARNGKDTY